jgi:hypothetical protein
MAVNKVMIKDAGNMMIDAPQGAGFMDRVRVSNNTTDADYTLTVADVMGGIYQRSGTNTSRSETLPTMALLVAANPNWDIGETLRFDIANASSANSTTIVTGSGITLVGSATVPVNGRRSVYLRKDSATAGTAYIC